MEKGNYILQSVENALGIMDLLSQHEELGVAEIHKFTGLGRASVFRLLYTLEAGGYVSKSASAKYRLSNKFAHYGNIVIGRYDLVMTARPYLQKLRDLSNQTTHLSVMTGDGKSTFLYKEATNNAIQMLSQIGLSMDASSTASGKSMLAQLDDAELYRLADQYAYEPLTETSIKNKMQLIREIQLIRQRGYAEDLEEHEVGLTCYAAPIYGLNNECVAAISVSGATALMQRDRDQLIEHLLDVARQLSRELGAQN